MVSCLNFSSSLLCMYSSLRVMSTPSAVYGCNKPFIMRLHWTGQPPLSLVYLRHSSPCLLDFEQAFGFFFVEGTFYNKEKRRLLLKCERNCCYTSLVTLSLSFNNLVSILHSELRSFINHGKSEKDYIFHRNTLFYFWELFWTFCLIQIMHSTLCTFLESAQERESYQ